ncbi:uncharacterized protein LOC144989313 isoform X2 [Oryzias latipes]
MPSPFDLADFLGNPSVEALECFLKDDLVKIATHFGITFGGHTRKRELKSLIVTRLEELDLVTLSGRSALVTPKDKDDAARGAGECKPKVKTPFTLPRYDSSSPDGAAGSGEGARLKVRLARLELEAREKHEQAQRDLQLQIRKLEIEADTAVRIRQLELSAQQGGPSAGIAEDQHSGAPAAPPLSQHPAVFDITFADDPDRKADTQEAAETPESGASAVEEVPLPVDRARLGAEQKADPTLRQYFSRAMDATQVGRHCLVVLVGLSLHLQRRPRPSALEARTHKLTWPKHQGG